MNGDRPMEYGLVYRIGYRKHRNKTKGIQNELLQ